MAQTVCVILSSSDRQMLEAIVADRNRPQKHVERARVVLAAASCGRCHEERLPQCILFLTGQG